VLLALSTLNFLNTLTKPARISRKYRGHGFFLLYSLLCIAIIKLLFYLWIEKIKSGEATWYFLLSLFVIKRLFRVYVNHNPPGVKSTNFRTDD
jgi:hypothetical protein